MVIITGGFHPLAHNKADCKRNAERLYLPIMGLIVLLFALTMNARVAKAQTSGTGAITGLITDANGAVVADVRVKATNVATGETREVRSNADGVFVLALLTPGTYTVQATAKGFKQTIQKDVEVKVTETAGLNIRLEVGAVEEEQLISADMAMVQTDSSALGRVADERAIDNLPLVTRNYQQIIGLSPGINTPVNDAGALGRGSAGVPNQEGTGVYVHGGRPYDNNFQMNGIEVNSISSGLPSGVPVPNPDTIQEFKVQTGQYDAAFGRNAGANVNLVTKSGTNSLHGAVFEFFRNDALNANDFFFNEAGQPRPVLKQNQFGVTLGGPIKKDKLFFFGSYQGTRQVNGISNQGFNKCRDTAFLPPLTNDRSAAAIGKIYAGQRGLFQNLFGGVGPSINADGSNINPIALKLLQLKLTDGSYLIPTPQIINRSLPLDEQGFSSFSIPCTFDENQFMTNVDYLVSDKSKISARFFDAHENQNVSLPPGNTHQGNIPGFPEATVTDFRNLSVSHTYSISASLLNEARFGYNRGRSNSNQKSPFSWSDVGVAAAQQANDFPALIVAGMGLGVNYLTDTIENTYILTDSVSWVRGKHNLRFGGGLTHAQSNTDKFQFNSTVEFPTVADFLLGLNGTQNGTFGLFSNVLASIDLLGLPERDFNEWQGTLYVQDDFKVTRRFTLNLGLRYEYIGGFSESHGRNGTFNAALANPNPPLTGSLQGYVVSSDFKGALPSGVTKVDNPYAINGDGHNKLAPRIGYAWQVLPNSDRLVIRGGYGIYYSMTKAGLVFQMATGPPFAALRVLEAQAAGNATFASPFAQPLLSPSDFPIFTPYSPTSNLSINAVAPDFQPSVVQQYSTNVQTRIANSFLLEVGYVGSRGTKLYRSRDIDQANLASPEDPIHGITTNTLDNIPFRRPILGFGRLIQVESAGASWYNGLEVSLTKRFSKGLQFLASYTWSKSLDSDGAVVDLSSAAGGNLGNSNDPKSRYGRSSFDRPHRFVFSGVYDLPHPESTKGFAGTMLSGWRIAGVTTIQSGRALTIEGTNANSAYGVVNDRAETSGLCNYGQMVTKGSVTSKLNNYFNSSCFTNNYPIIPGTMLTGFGDSGVGIVNGPDQNNTDIALIKRTFVGWVHEGSNIEFRAEFFNAFNTPQFADPGVGFGSPGFGTIISTSVNPRIIQFALKFNF